MTSFENVDELLRTCACRPKSEHEQPERQLSETEIIRKWREKLPDGMTIYDASHCLCIILSAVVDGYGAWSTEIQDRIKEVFLQYIDKRMAQTLFASAFNEVTKMRLRFGKKNSMSGHEGT